MITAPLPPQLHQASCSRAATRPREPRPSIISRRGRTVTAPTPTHPYTVTRPRHALHLFRQQTTLPQPPVRRPRPAIRASAGATPAPGRARTIHHSRTGTGGRFRTLMTRASGRTRARGSARLEPTSPRRRRRCCNDTTTSRAQARSRHHRPQQPMGMVTRTGMDILIQVR